ncbi:hypothetical protein KIL84_022106 [Mauremys mutica]|uniref:Uncharacterized protein n=1 Tax=Mauremys mutica TaxID=74926 RepID=A0A9D3X9B8_9SAUR|nr:hypothetical protein KIL84_022106 [Mauremys mutica]
MSHGARNPRQAELKHLAQVCLDTSRAFLYEGCWTPPHAQPHLLCLSIHLTKNLSLEETGSFHCCSQGNVTGHCGTLLATLKKFTTGLARRAQQYCIWPIAGKVPLSEMKGCVDALL